MPIYVHKLQHACACKTPTMNMDASILCMFSHSMTYMCVHWHCAHMGIYRHMPIYVPMYPTCTLYRHVHVYVHVVQHIYAHINMYVYTCTHLSIYRHVCTSMHTHIHQYGHVHACTPQCTNVHVPKPLTVYIYTCTHIPAWIDMHIHTLICTLTHTI